jgi:hypothetical protein
VLHVAGRSVPNGAEMQDFGDFCYLDNPRTGSTYISAFLSRQFLYDVFGYE